MTQRAPVIRPSTWKVVSCACCRHACCQLILYFECLLQSTLSNECKSCRVTCLRNKKVAKACRRVAMAMGPADAYFACSHSHCSLQASPAFTFWHCFLCAILLSLWGQHYAIYAIPHLLSPLGTASPTAGCRHHARTPSSWRLAAKDPRFDCTAKGGGEGKSDGTTAWQCFYFASRQR